MFSVNNKYDVWLNSHASNNNLLQIAQNEKYLEHSRSGIGKDNKSIIANMVVNEQFMLVFVCLTDRLINGGNVGGGATVELGISFPIMPIPCNCSGRSDVDDWRLKPPLPAIFSKPTTLQITKNA